MKELIELFAEKVGRYPRGNVQDELRSWAANEITTLRQQLEQAQAESVQAAQQGSVPEGWRVIRMPELQKALMTGPIIGLDGPRGESVPVVSDSDDRRERHLYQFLDALLSTPQPAQQVSVPLRKELEALADDYVEGYEFRGDEGDYQPTERERFLIEDCVAGLMDEIHQILKRATPQPEGNGWKPNSEGPTGWEFRFVEALRNLCGGAEPPDRLVKGWLTHENDELQGWVVSNCTFHWAMGATVIDAAMALADEPEEGAGHDLKRPQPPAP